MTGAWVSFVDHLDPNPISNESVPSWPDYGVGAQNMVFVADASSVEEDDYRAEGIDFWTEQRIKGCRNVPVG